MRLEYKGIQWLTSNLASLVLDSPIWWWMDPFWREAQIVERLFDLVLELAILLLPLIYPPKVQH